MLTKVKDAGFPEDFKVIHLFEGGSALHGARLEGKQDLDLYGIFLEPAEKSLGLDPYEHFVTSTSDNSRRNTAEDVDITLYSLRRWAELAAKGNPTAINFLFAENILPIGGREAVWWINKTGLKRAILAKSAAGHYTGFADGQMRRLLGIGTGKHGQRPELSEQYGYDTKAAMHAVRLLSEGIELMRHQYVTFPRPDAAKLIDIRQGKWSLDHVCSEVSLGIKLLEDARDHSALPEKPDRKEVSRLITEVYLEEYNGL